MKERLMPGFLKNFSVRKLWDAVTEVAEKITACNMEEFIARIDKNSDDKRQKTVEF